MTPVHDGTAVQHLGRVVADTPAETIDPKVIRKAALHLLDTIGAGIAGANSAEASAARAAYKVDEASARPTVSRDGAPDVSVALWGLPRASDERTAALLNGIAAHALEIDDTQGSDHSGATIVPAVLALAATTPTSGRELLGALVKGYDVARRVLHAAGGYAAMNARGWHSTGVCGSLGAAAGGAALLGLDCIRASSAIALAGSYSGGLWAFIEDGAMAKRLHAGRAAETGLTAARLAEHGFTGPMRLFEAEWGGYFSSYVPSGATPEALHDRLGSRWLIDEAAVKPYASCRDTHSAIDIVFDHPEIHLTDVTEITITLSSFVERMCGAIRTETPLDAQMSVPYCVAVALLHRAVMPPQFMDRVRNSAPIRSLLSLTRVTVDDTWDDYHPPHLAFRTRDGRIHEFEGKQPLGSPERPLTEEAIVNKFFEVTRDVMPRTSTQRIADAVLDLDGHRDCTELLAALRQH